MVPGWRDLGPSEADLAFFEEHGWYFSPVVLSVDALDGALASCARFYAGERDWPLPGESAEAQRRAAGAARLVDFVALQSAPLRGFLLQPVIGAIAARLL